MEEEVVRLSHQNRRFIIRLVMMGGWGLTREDGMIRGLVLSTDVGDQGEREGRDYETPVQGVVILNS